MKCLAMFFALFTCLTLSGCVTTDPTNLEEAKFIAPSDQKEKTDLNNVQVTVVRDYGSIIGSPFKYYVFDNKKKLAELSTKEKTTFYTTEGKHIIACGWFSGSDVQHFEVFTKDEEAVYHCGFYGTGQPYINRVK